MKAQVDAVLKEGGEIKSEEDYVRWVRKWKATHNRMVGIIQFVRQDVKDSGLAIRTNEVFLTKNDLPPPTDDQIGHYIEVMSGQQHNLALLRPIAREMYDARVTHKDLLKKGQYPKLELHKGDEITRLSTDELKMDGHNSKQATMSVG